MRSISSTVASVLASAWVFCFTPRLTPAQAPAGAPDTLDHYNVAWDQPGKSSADSMPLGNGDIGLNVWTEPSGDVLFYVGKNDAWTDNPARNPGLAKVGRVRISFSPSALAPNAPFKQELVLRDGQLRITEGPQTVTIWVDANAPVIHVESAGPTPRSMKVAMESWRTTATKDLNADTVFNHTADRVAWCYAGRNQTVPEMVGRTFGAVMKGDGLKATDNATLESATPTNTNVLSVHVSTAQTPTPGAWLAGTDTLIARADAVPLEQARAAHVRWWHDFWNRSWVFVSGDKLAERTTEGYLLQRFVNACTSRGTFPIKFNGSLFTVDHAAEKINKVTEPVTADFRAWGGQYWFQNTRPVYWPMLASGDFDLMRPLFRMYQAQLPLNTKLVKEFYGHDGAYLAETAPFFGGINKITKTEPGSYTKHYFTPILELSSLMLDYYHYTGDADFARKTLIPVADAGLTFFSQHFPRDDHGKLLLDPDNSIEMFWKVKNPLPDIAGLHWVTQGLLALPADLADAPSRERWQKLQDELPPVPTGTRDGRRMLFPYEPGQEPRSHNFENPELYAVYPFRLYGLGKPDLDLARNAWDARKFKSPGCWSQDPVEAALLGDADGAKKATAFDLTRKDPGEKFPAFWDRGHDYMPDEDNGGNGLLGLQTMLIQSEGKKILLAPAWPKGWNAAFKLHAPEQTTVQATVTDGKVTIDDVDPTARRADIIINP